MMENFGESNLISTFSLSVVIVGLAALYYFKRRHNPLLPGMRGRPILYYYIFLRAVYWQKLKAIPPICLILQVMCGFCKLFDREKLARFWVLNRPFVLFYKPETVEVILSNPVAIEKSCEYQFLHPWLGTGLLTSTGNKWRFRRKLLTPSFHFRVLDDFLPIFNEQSQILVSKLETLTDKPWVDVVPLLTMCTLDIICHTAMGVKINAQSGGCSEYVRAIYEIGEIFLHRVVRPWLWIDAIFYFTLVGKKFKSNLQIVHDFTRKVIKEKKMKMIEKNNDESSLVPGTNESPSIRKKRHAFLELLLEYHLADRTFTEEDIREEVDTFMFEGHDTTAMAICWTLYNLGLNPGIQDEVHRELDGIFEHEPSRCVNRDDLTQMKYLECVIKETLRLYPSVPFIARELREDLDVLKYTVPADSVCVVFPLMLHRDPESFPNPEKFDPERFFPENCSGRHPYAYVPFSAGPRNCIGQKFAIMEEKTVVANILRNFQVESLDQRDKVNVVPDLITRNIDPIRMKFTPR